MLIWLTDIERYRPKMPKIRLTGDALISTLRSDDGTSRIAQPQTGEPQSLPPHLPFWPARDQSGEEEGESTRANA